VKARALPNRIEVLPGKGTICAVFVTYHPDVKFPERLAQIVPQVAHIVIVDNGSDDEAVRTLRLLCEFVNGELIANGENLGIATALNQGARRAIERGYAWALMLDQDSWPEADLVTTLSEIYRTHPDRQKVQMLGSNYRSAATGYIALDCNNIPSNFVERKAVITSGSLLSLEAFKEIGQFRDDFFIDQVDDEYCLRLRAHGYTVIISCKPLIVHSLGSETRHKFLWKRPVCSNQPPLRKYYVTRNRIILYREYFFKEREWAIQSLRSMFREILLIFLYEDQKIAKLRAIALGVWHAFTGNMGRLEGRVLEKI
jgi:rhamnosyltransferase